MEVGERIKALRSRLHMNQSDFAVSIGITQGGLSKIESGHSRVALDTLLSIAAAYKVDLDWLATGRGDIFISEVEVPSFSSSAIGAASISSLSDVRLVSELALSDYPTSRHDASFISSLPTLSLPMLGKGAHRCFSMVGPHMESRIHHGDYLVCRHVPEVGKLRSGRVYVLLAERQGVLCRRFAGVQDDSLALICDHRDYGGFTLPVSQALECWEVCFLISRMLEQDGSHL